uniref:BRCT domain-containing protein n=1 Tax=Physcomitrium patens TaxID=3218 RepID=A0A7I4E3R4_PHYPA
MHSCSGRKFEHALKHGLHRGLYVVTLPWFLNSAKQYERLDESLYSVQKSIADAITSENISDTIASSSWQNSCMPATCDLGSAYRQNNSVSKPRSSGGSVKTSASTPRTPHSTHTIHASNSNTALSGARFYVDPDLPDDLQAKVQEAVESWGATCVELWSKNNNTTHVVCDPNSLSKYIGLNLHLVSPMWVLSARDGFPLRCVQYSADLARNVADLLSVKENGTLPKGSINTCGRPGNARVADSHLQDRQEKATAAKAGVRRRRGPRMQPCRTLPRPITPTTLLDSICWVVTDTPSAAEVYTDSSGKASFENDEAKNGYEDDNGQYRDPGNKVSDKEFYTRLLSESEKREIVFRGAFLTILFPIDRFSELGPSSRTFFSEGGFSREKIIELIHSFYQEYMSPDEIDAAIHTDSKHADRLRTAYSSEEVDELGYVPILRSEFLGSRRQFEGLKRIGQEQTSHIYDLWLGS